MAMIRDGFPITCAIRRRWGFELEDVPLGEAFDPGVVARRTGRQPVSDRRLIDRVEATWRALEELGQNVQNMLVEEAAIVGR
jgi:hypothetical protein